MNKTTLNKTTEGKMVQNEDASWNGLRFSDSTLNFYLILVEIVLNGEEKLLKKALKVHCSV